MAFDVQRDEEGRPLLRRVVDRLPVDRERPTKVLDVGGGYGVFTAELLESLPQSSVVLLDLSRPMLEQARKRLVDYGHRVTYLQADLREAGWTSTIDGPFEIVASAMAIHNVRYGDLIRQVYLDLAGL